MAKNRTWLNFYQKVVEKQRSAKEIKKNSSKKQMSTISQGSRKEHLKDV